MKRVFGSRTSAFSAVLVTNLFPSLKAGAASDLRDEVSSE